MLPPTVYTPFCTDIAAHGHSISSFCLSKHSKGVQHSKIHLVTEQCYIINSTAM